MKFRKVFVITALSLFSQETFATEESLARDIQAYCSISDKIASNLLPSRYFFFWKEARAGRLDLEKVHYAGLIRTRFGASLQRHDRQHVRMGSKVGSIVSVQATFCGLAILAADPAISQIEDGSGSSLEVLP
jgi:hypothetical protein